MTLTKIGGKHTTIVAIPRKRAVRILKRAVTMLKVTAQLFKIRDTLAIRVERLIEIPETLAEIGARLDLFGASPAIARFHST